MTAILVMILMMVLVLLLVLVLVLAVLRCYCWVLVLAWRWCWCCTAAVVIRLQRLLALVFPELESVLSCGMDMDPSSSSWACLEITIPWA